MQHILSSKITLFILTIIVFYACRWVYIKSRKLSILHPIITSATIIIAYLSILKIDYSTYKSSTMAIDLMLGPCVVSLGYLMYRYVEYLKAHVASICISMTAGFIASIVSILIITNLMGCTYEITQSLLPKSVTTPIAIFISQSNGGIVSITVAAVIITGIVGGIISSWVFRWFGIKSALAQGLALGAAAHGFGTASALERGTVHGALAGLAMGLMGLITAIMSPFFDIL